MRFLCILLLCGTLLLPAFPASAQTPAPAEPQTSDGLSNEELAIAAAKAALAAHAEGDLREATMAYGMALLLGLPEDLVPPVAAGFCIAKLNIHIDRTVLDACYAVLRHERDGQHDHAETLGEMLVQMAQLLSDERYYDETARVLQEFDRRYADLNYPDMTYERQRADLARAEMLRGNGRPKDGLAILDRLSKERLQFPHDYSSVQMEIDTLAMLRIRLFAAHDLGDRELLRDAIHRLSSIGERLRTAEGFDYLAAIMTCQAFFMVHWPDPNEPGLTEQIDLRTDALLYYLERAFTLDPQRALLPPYAMRLVKLCAPQTYFALMPLDLYQRLEAEGLGVEAVRQMLDDYDYSRFAEANTQFQRLIAGLEAIGHPHATRMSRRLALLRKYLLNAPGRRARG